MFMINSSKRYVWPSLGNVKVSGKSLRYRRPRNGRQILEANPPSTLRLQRDSSGSKHLPKDHEWRTNLTEFSVLLITFLRLTESRRKTSAYSIICHIESILKKHIWDGFCSHLSAVPHSAGAARTGAEGEGTSPAAFLSCSGIWCCAETCHCNAA